jgi:hypothetical protein
MMEETMFVLAGISPMAINVSNAQRSRNRILTNSIARSRHDLESIGEGLSGTVIDEIVRGGLGQGLANFSGSDLIASIIGGSGLDGISSKDSCCQIGVLASV